MKFNSFDFLVFFPIVYLLYVGASRRLQNLLLLVASYVFYGWWDWRFLGLLLASTCIDYYCGRRIHDSPDPIRNRWLVVSVCANLGMLGVFKYFNFFAESFSRLASVLGWHPDPVTLDLVLPVGISFYTFQTMSYTIDIHRRELQPCRDFLDYALFVAFFPQLVAGPIERAKRLLPQLTSPRRIRQHDVEQGLWLILWGYFLKVFVADNLAVTVDHAFGHPQTVTGGEVVLATYAFAFQIFGDFAGYSSIAIGLARVLGIELMTNFRLPYFVTNPSDFWRNWHISLSTWLRDYLYISLGGNRHGALMTYRNLFLTMLLGGLWHGASWIFVLWGLYQGALLILHRASFAVLDRLVPASLVSSKAWLLLRIAFMFQLTCFGWLIFRSDSFADLESMSAALLGGRGDAPPTLLSGWLELAVTIAPVLAVMLLQARSRRTDAVLGLPATARWPIYVAMCYCILLFGRMEGDEFIYFQF